MGLIITGIKGLLIIVIGAIYLPINMFLNWIGPLVHLYWRRKDYVMFFLAGILFLPSWGIIALISAPYEKMVESMH